MYLVLSLVGAHDMLETIEEDTALEMSMITHQKAEELNVRLSGIERAVDELAKYIEKNADAERMKTDEAYMTEFMDQLSVRSIDAARIA